MSIYDIITNRIVEEIERNNVLPWEKEWGCNSIPVNTVSQKPYRGVNLLLLPQTPSNEFISWCQLSDLRENNENLKLKKGCKQHMVVFYSTIKDKLSVADKEEEQKEKGFLKYYKVFAIEDVEGLESRRKIICNNHNPIEEAESLINSYLHRENISLSLTDEDKAFYSPTFDRISIPKLQYFQSVNSYYQTFMHEIIHSSGNEKRLNRLSKTAFFGNHDYSLEELCAELGANFLCCKLNLQTDKSIRNGAAYIKSWLQVLKNDKTFIYRASAQAQKAVDFILNATT